VFYDKKQNNIPQHLEVLAFFIFRYDMCKLSNKPQTFETKVN